MLLRVIRYNILDGGENREAYILKVIQAANPDIVILQEVYSEKILQSLSQVLGMQYYFGNGNKRRKVALLSKLPVSNFKSHHPIFPIWRNFIDAEIKIAPSKTVNILGVHPMANLGIVFEIWRFLEASFIIDHIQAGWLKNSGNSAPSYFVEYWNGCGNYCAFYYGTIDSNTHEYRVARSGSNWCGYIDGAQKACVSTSQLGFTTTSDQQYFGETTNTAIQLGGTGASHFRMTQLSTYISSWTQVNTNNLSLYVSSGTSYHASKGFTSPDTWEDNWTQ